jgi:hypothetical protein
LWSAGEDLGCLKHLVGGQQLQIDYKPETTSLEKAEFGESGYSIGAVVMNWILVGMSRIWLDNLGHKIMHVIQLFMMVSCGHKNEDESMLRTIVGSLLLSMCLLLTFQYQH